jgi:outer membrane receptor protein involved in Fe transport
MGARLRRSLRKIATLVSALLRALSVCMALALGVVAAAFAESNAPEALTAPIAAQPLAQALEAFAEQTGLHVAYVSGIVGNQISQAVPAGLSAKEALARLLQGTGLKFEFFTANSIRILADERATGPSPPTPEASQPPMQSVIVTGSRIPVPANITATSPLVVVTAQDILVTGYTDTGDVINALPQMITTFGDGGNYGGAGWGTTTADLRGLGPQRTVVLVNGKRLGLGDPSTGNGFPAPDLDQIPLPMIERVEVLTGGASATYGSDAVAGVVNFILKDHVHGVQIDAQYGSAQHAQHNYYLQDLEAASGTAPPTGTTLDGSKRDLSVLAGTGFHDGAGHVTGYFVYHGQDALHGSDRDFSDCSVWSANVLTDLHTRPGVMCVGLKTSNLFVPLGLKTSNLFIASDLGDPPPRYSIVGNRFVPWPAAGSVPPPFFNSAAYESVQRQNTRYQAGLLAHVEFSPAAAPYFEFSFMDDHSDQQFAASALFIGDNRLSLTGDGNYLVNCSNPLLSAQEATILCTPAAIAADKANPGAASADVLIGRRNIEGRPRLTTFVHQNYRAVAGIGGKLSDAWSYDASALYYHTSSFRKNENFLNYAAVNKALQVTTDRSGHPVCISGGSCVPYNIFKTGGVTAQQLAYLSESGTDDGANSEQIIEADVTGQLGWYGLIAPWAREGFALNAGAEHRAETLRYTPDAAELSGELAGGDHGVVALDNRVSVDEGFLEFRIPIAQHRPLINDLTVDAGYRYSVYSTGITANTYKVDLQFAPVADMRLRTSFDHVVRAPNPIELFAPLVYDLGAVVIDPCAPVGAAHATATLTQCIHMGVTAAEYGNGGSTNTITQCPAGCGVARGGNPGLAPETADTWSLGVTLTPTAIPSFTASVDYFHIRLTGEIGTIPEDITLEQCLASSDPTWCSQIVRTPAGALFGPTPAGGYIAARNVNTGAALVSGIDVQANYRQLLPGRWGALNVSLNGSWLQHNSSTPYRSAQSYDCAGFFGRTCGSVNPTWRHNLRVTWEVPWNLQLSAQWRFIGRTGFDNNSPQSALQNQEQGFFDPVLTQIPNYSYLDLAANWNVTGHVQLRAGVNNAFDKDPPLLPSGEIYQLGGLNTFTTYDIVGREIFVALRATF